MVNVAIVKNLSSDRIVSMNRYADELLIASQAESGWSGTCVSLPEPAHQDVVSIVAKLRRLKRRFIDYPGYVRTVAADVYHIAEHGYSYLLNALPNQRTVVTCHDLMLLTQAEWHDQNAWPPHKYMFRYRIAAMDRAARVIAVSEKTRSDIRRLGLADDDRVRVIPPPVSPVFTATGRTERDAARSRLGVSRTDLVLLHVGSNSAYKNVETVVDVLAGLRAKRVPATLIKVGQGPPIDLSRKIAQLGLSKCIVQAGHVDDFELASIYGCADVLVFPSTKEGFGWPVVEAMASGLPVVASNVDAITESLDGCGIQVAPLDVGGFIEGIESLQRNAFLRNDFINRGLARARDFSRITVGARMRRLYEEVYQDALRQEP